MDSSLSGQHISNSLKQQGPKEGIHFENVKKQACVRLYPIRLAREAIIYIRIKAYHDEGTARVSTLTRRDCCLSDSPLAPVVTSDF